MGNNFVLFLFVFLVLVFVDISIADECKNQDIECYSEVNNFEDISWGSVNVAWQDSEASDSLKLKLLQKDIDLVFSKLTPANQRDAIRILAEQQGQDSNFISGVEKYISDYGTISGLLNDPKNGPAVLEKLLREAESYDLARESPEIFEGLFKHLTKSNLVRDGTEIDDFLFQVYDMKITETEDGKYQLSGRRSEIYSDDEYLLRQALRRNGIDFSTFKGNIAYKDFIKSYKIDKEFSLILEQNHNVFTIGSPFQFHEDKGGFDYDSYFYGEKTGNFPAISLVLVDEEYNSREVGVGGGVPFRLSYEEGKTYLSDLKGINNFIIDVSYKSDSRYPTFISKHIGDSSYILGGGIKDNGISANIDITRISSTDTIEGEKKQTMLYIDGQRIELKPGDIGLKFDGLRKDRETRFHLGEDGRVYGYLENSLIDFSLEEFSNYARSVNAVEGNPVTHIIIDGKEYELDERAQDSSTTSYAGRVASEIANRALDDNSFFRRYITTRTEDSGVLSNSFVFYEEEIPQETITEQLSEGNIQEDIQIEQQIEDTFQEIISEEIIPEEIKPEQRLENDMQNIIPEVVEQNNNVLNNNNELPRYDINPSLTPPQELIEMFIYENGMAPGNYLNEDHTTYTVVRPESENPANQQTDEDGKPIEDVLPQQTEESQAVEDQIVENYGSLEDYYSMFNDMETDIEEVELFLDEFEDFVNDINDYDSLDNNMELTAQNDQSNNDQEELDPEIQRMVDTENSIVLRETEDTTEFLIQDQFDTYYGDNNEFHLIGENVGDNLIVHYNEITNNFMISGTGLYEFTDEQEQKKKGFGNYYLGGKKENDKYFLDEIRVSSYKNPELNLRSPGTMIDESLNLNLYISSEDETPAVFSYDNDKTRFLTPINSEWGFGQPISEAINWYDEKGNHIGTTTSLAQKPPTVSNPSSLIKADVNELTKYDSDLFYEVKTLGWSHTGQGAIETEVAIDVSSEISSISLTGHSIYKTYLPENLDISEINPEQNIHVKSIKLISKEAEYNYVPLDYKIRIGEYGAHVPKTICFRNCNSDDNNTIYIRNDDIGIVSSGILGNVELGYEGNKREVIDSNMIWLTKDSWKEFTSNFKFLKIKSINNFIENDLLTAINKEAKFSLELRERLKNHKELFLQKIIPASYTNLKDKCMFINSEKDIEGYIELGIFSYISDDIRKLVVNRDSYNNLIEFNKRDDIYLMLPLETFVNVDDIAHYSLQDDLSLSPKVYESYIYFKSPRETINTLGEIING